MSALVRCNGLQVGHAPCPFCGTGEVDDRREAVVRTRPVDAQRESASAASSVSALPRRRRVWRQDQSASSDNCSGINRCVADERLTGPRTSIPATSGSGLLRLRIPSQDEISPQALEQAGAAATPPPILAYDPRNGPTSAAPVRRGWWLKVTGVSRTSSASIIATTSPSQSRRLKNRAGRELTPRRRVTASAARLGCAWRD